MKRVFDNSCMKGCMVYLAALIVIIGLGAVGLGSLNAKPGAGATSAQPGISAVTAPSGQAAVDQSAQQPAQQPTKESNSEQPNAQINISLGQPGQQKQPETTAPTSTPQQPAQQTMPLPSVSNIAPQVQVQIQTQAHDLEVTGQASAPFYIVQDGDTLWDIARKFGTTIDALSAVNKLGEDLIKPNQLLYLPESNPPSQPQSPQSQVPSEPAAPAPDNTGDTSSGPDMPRTGVNTKP